LTPGPRMSTFPGLRCILPAGLRTVPEALRYELIMRQGMP